MNYTLPGHALLNRTVLCLLLLLSPYLLKAQDKIFSQFYNAPLLTNPAYTGFMDQDYRVQTIYRSQWQSLTPYKTFGASADMNIPFASNPAQKIGVGLVFYRDQMTNTITDNTILVSASFIRVLDRAKRHKVSWGLQGGYVSKSIDPFGLYFENQIGGDHNVNTSLPSGENIDQGKLNYINVHTGLAYAFQVNKKLEFKTGLSVFNLMAPKESFLVSSGGTLETLKQRMFLTLGARYQLTDRWYLFPEVLVVIQQGAKEITPGTGVGYLLDPDVQRHIMVMAGVWYRTSGAGIGMLGMGYKNVTAMFTYDQVVSSLKEVNTSSAVSGQPVNAFELSMIYKGFLNRAIAPKHTIPCGIY